MPRFFVLLLALAFSGCSLLPDISHHPTLHNPYPQLSKVAVAPFFNLSSEPTVDGRRFALAYFNELQLVPGFEVVPVGVVEQAMQGGQINLAGPDDARRLAQMLGVDAVVIGAVTDYSPYYPPRCAMQVEWYAANPGFHPIPAGYGLPWGTAGELEIPGPLVFEAEYELAKAQLATQTPCKTAEAPQQVVPPQPMPVDPSSEGGATAFPGVSKEAGIWADQQVRRAGYDGPPIPTPAPTTDPIGEVSPGTPGMPPDWPDPRGFIPPPPAARPPTCWPSDAPVMRHTQAYNGHDPEFTEALATYYYFQDDARFGGWQSYLERSEDFIRFCCRMHLWEMLSARGGAGETRVVWRWPMNR
jgi:hypothetical protein